MRAPYTRAIVLFLCGVAASVAQDDRAGLTGSVQDITGVGVSGAYAELQSEDSQGKAFRVQADDSGTFHFRHLPAGEYSLKFGHAGFQSLIIKAIHVSYSEEKLMPPAELTVADISCSGYAVPDYLRLLPSEGHDGILRGIVLRDGGPKNPKSPPIVGADVTLICARDTSCGVVQTDSTGRFLFGPAPPGHFTIRVQRFGFYPVNRPGYRIQAGFESIYWPIFIERCPHGNCDPRLRPKKPPAYCE
jgi:carboxypeptidase family protein